MEAIKIVSQPLPETEVRQLQEWFLHPGRSLYQRHLADAAMVFFAEAINLEANGDPSDEAVQDDIKRLKEAGRGVMRANELLDKAMASDYKFVLSELRPQLTQPTQPTNGNNDQPAEKPATANTV